jgi:hypothetical protein
MQITQELVDSINKALDKGITIGMGNPVEGEMCVEALICYKLGLPHSDNPPCVGEGVRKAKIALNDCIWSSNKARAEGMRKLAIAQLGSSELDQKKFESRLKLISMQRILPYVIQKNIDGEGDKEGKLLKYKIAFSNSTTLDDKLWDSFFNCYYYYYSNNNDNNYFYFYHYYNNYYYHIKTCYNYYKYYHYYNNYYCCNYHKYHTYPLYYDDKFLSLIADCILQVLINMKSPGCNFI